MAILVSYDWGTQVGDSGRSNIFRSATREADKKGSGHEFHGRSLFCNLIPLAW